MHVRGCSRCTKVESALVARLKIARHVNLALSLAIAHKISVGHGHFSTERD